MDALLISFITLGVVLVIAAVIGGGLQVLGYNIPVIPGWERQVLAAVLGIVLTVLSWNIYTFRQNESAFKTALAEIENGAEGKPPPPWSPGKISTHLGDLVPLAGTDTERNCQVAGVIEVYKVSPIPLVVREKLQDSQKSSVIWLKCYRDVVALAGAHATVNASGSPKAEVASGTQSTAILEAVTTTSSRGWMYLGQLQADRSLGQSRTILQDRVKDGETVTTKTDVYIHAQGTAGNRAKTKVIGVVPVGSKVSILNLSLPSEPYLWAEVSVSTNALAATPQPSPTPQPSGARYAVGECGGVRDLQTALLWKLGPNKTMTWDETRVWVASLGTCNGKPWRMPTIGELRTIYDPQYSTGIGYLKDGYRYPAHISPLFGDIGDGSWGWSGK